MPKVIELLRQGRHEEIWQMCCGYLHLDIEQFMAVQNRLLLDQIETLGHSEIGRKIMHGAWPRTVTDFRQEVPLTTYEDYCPELSDKREGVLPQRPDQWVHTSGSSGEHSCKWVPMSPLFIKELSPILYGLGLLSASRSWGDRTPFVERPNFIYTVAPRPYISGALASILQEQTPTKYYPSLSTAESLPFEDRIRMGFKEAIPGGLDYFFGLSIVLTEIGNKFVQSSGHLDLQPYLRNPRALFRLTRALINSRLEGRSVLPKDIWRIRGIITSGLDSSVFKEKIKEYWGRYPLDVYANTEGTIIASQTWDYEGMTFIPNLNFLEFIPEQEHFKWQLNHKYQPKTVLLDEVNPGECYEIVITNFHGGSLTRYRVGDIIRIMSLRNENLGIDIPQMAFERRADDLLDFATIRLSEKTIWQAIENIGLPYADWIAFKIPGDLTLQLLIEPKDDVRIDEIELERSLYNQIMKQEIEAFATSQIHQDAIKTTKLEIKVSLLPRGAFAKYIMERRAQGADVAHLKPPHVNPNPQVLSSFLNLSSVPPIPVVRVPSEPSGVAV